MAVQLGSDSRLYFAYSDVVTPLTVDVLMNADGSENAVGTSANDLQPNLVLADCVKDVTVGGSNNTVDTTCRESARQGFSTSKITTSDSTMTVQMQYDALTDASQTTPGDGIWLGTNNPVLDCLLYCFTTKSAIWGIDADQTIEAAVFPGNGARGLSGNWSVGFSVTKEVQGQVVVEFELALESKAQMLVWAGDKFLALVDPN